MLCSDPIFVYPLLGADDAWSGYRVEFATGANSHETLMRLSSSPWLDEFDHRLPWLLPAPGIGDKTAGLGERAVTIFPTHAAPQDAEALGQLEASLRQAKHKLGLAATPDCKLPGAGTWDYLLIGTSHARSLPPFTLHGLASRTILVATDVHTANDREWALNNACTLSTGEFLQMRSNANNKADITRLKLLKLLALIAEDADTGALDKVFREEAKLSYSLLRLVNSAAISPRRPITSFSQAINLLGRRQLQRWLQLLVYSDPNNGQHPNPLLQKAAARGRLLERLSKSIEPASLPENSEDIAFMVGTFSLLDVLLNMPMPEILHHLPLPEIAHKALAEHDGPLGQLLAALDAADKNETKIAMQRLQALGIDANEHLDAQLEALNWAAKIRPAV